MVAAIGVTIACVLSDHDWGQLDKTQAWHINKYLGKGSKKKTGKSMVFYQTRGGVSEGSEKTKLLFWGLKKGQKWPKMA